MVATRLCLSVANPTSFRFEEAVMQSHIRLLAVGGTFTGKNFDLSREAHYVAGRSSDCDLVLTGEGSGAVSRHHCLFQVEDVGVTVADLGSRNGTYINGECIGRRSAAEPEDNTIGRSDFVAYELADGDEIQIGDTLFRLGIEAGSKTYERLAAAAP
jgi:eukaryotic-like serine/threonine-protein kinase